MGCRWIVIYLAIEIVGSNYFLKNLNLFVERFK